MILMSKKWIYVNKKLILKKSKKMKIIELLMINENNIKMKFKIIRDH